MVHNVPQSAGDILRVHIVANLVSGAGLEALSSHESTNECRDRSSTVFVGTVRIKQPRPCEVDTRIRRQLLAKKTRAKLSRSVQTRRSRWTVFSQIADVGVI